MIMVAPGPGSPGTPGLHRGRRCSCLIAVHQDASGKGAKETALAYAKGNDGRPASLRPHLREETETDLLASRWSSAAG